MTLMKRSIVFALAIAGLAAAGPLIGAANAQTTSAPPAVSPGNAGSPPSVAPGGSAGALAPNATALGTPNAGRQALREQARAAREACRDEAKAQGLKGPDRRQHIQDCFAAKMPQVAKRIECRKEGQAKGMTQPGLRDFVRQCVASKG
jgi:hypothetical protein